MKIPLWILFASWRFFPAERTVDRSRFSVSVNVGSVCYSFELEIDAEISVVPVQRIVPVVYGEFVARFCLMLGIPREGDRDVQIKLNVFSILEVR